MPSNPTDPRFRATRSHNCPNDISQEEAQPQAPAPKAGLCGHCAWGFYSMDTPGPQPGESIALLVLHSLHVDGTAAGYKAQCGAVRLHRDQKGRIGAVRKVNGEDRFFPGIEGNWAFERYKREHPELAAVGYA